MSGTDVLTSNAASRKGAQYHTRCTGEAHDTALRHSADPTKDTQGEGMTLFGANFCPFVQRVWIALEHLGPIAYQYYEIDPYKKPKELLDVNPKGLVPALKIGQDKCLGESTVILEYLADRYSGSPVPFLKGDPYLRAKQRLASDHVNRNLLPAFYRYLQAQETPDQIQFGNEFVSEIVKFQTEMLPETTGVFWDGTQDLGWVDIMAAPWLLRASIVLQFYRGFDVEKIFPDKSSRLRRYLKALFAHPSVRATTSTEELYLDSYARYAENRPNTSQVANAINLGRGLP